MKYTDKAVDYFERHSTSNECHITSDGRVFHAIGNAISFANEHNLQDQTIESYTREQVEQIDTTDVENTMDNLGKVLETNYSDENQEVDLENKDVSDINVGDIEKNEILEQEDIEENQVADSKIEELKNFDIATGDYQDVKAFIKHFEIETADQKAETLKTALTEFKNTLNQ